MNLQLFDKMNINFVERRSQLKEIDGKVLADFKITVPDFWSQTSVDILAQKYARRSGIPIYLKKISEDGIPDWMFRSEEDVEAFLSNNPDSLHINEFHENAGLRYKSESDARMIFGRVAGCWTYWGWQAGYFRDEDDAWSFMISCLSMMLHQEAVANSPQQFNAGIHWAYGIKGEPQGHMYYDTNIGDCVKSTSAYERPQLHACFLQSVDDSLLGDGGILDLVVREATTFKYGSGSGTNFSNLRAKNEPLSGGGFSSGVMSFLNVFDQVGGAIKSGGKTRRAAKMNVLDVDHPEILDYISCKMKEEHKVASMVTGSEVIKFHLDKIKVSADGNFNLQTNQVLCDSIVDAVNSSVPVSVIIRALALLKEGIEDVAEVFTADFNGSAYASVNMQNANNSVRITDEFINAVVHNDVFKLINRTDKTKFTEVSARQIWDSLCLSAWSCGDPGLHMGDTMASWHTCPASGPVRTTNPCSEVVFLDNTACNLASLNLVKFQLPNGRLDTGRFVQAVRTWIKVLEISVYIAQYPSYAIALNSHRFRILGLGYANLGSFLMRVGVPYDSDEARSIAGYITAVMHGAAYEMSADLAEMHGAFDAYELNKEHVCRVIENHRRAVFGQACESVNIQPRFLDHSYLTEYESSNVKEMWNRCISKVRKHGVRNAQVTLLAPTGTTGIMMGVATTGIEPFYMLVTQKKLSGGGYMKLVDDSVEKGLIALEYEPYQIDAIKKHILGHATLIGSEILEHALLLKHGFTKDEINKIEKALPDVFYVDQALSEFIVGSRIFDQFNIKNHGRNGKVLLQKMISDEQIEKLNWYVCGHMCIEDAPFIKQEHLSVFDCAVPNGEYGQRSINTKGHVLMASTVQPFLSGAISKTFNQNKNIKVKSDDYDSDVDADESISNVFMLCHKHGVKCATVFRDGSKMSSPLGSFVNNDVFELVSRRQKRSSNSINNSTFQRGQRELLPSKRHGYTQKVRINGESLYHTTGNNVDGEIRELFITSSGREGSAFRSVMSCFAKAVSIGLQYGVPIEEFIHAFAFVSFTPSGFVSGHQQIKKSSSVIDYIFRDIGINYCGMNQLANVDEYQDVQDVNFSKNNDSGDNTDNITRNAKFNASKSDQSSFGRYTGSFCGQCGSSRMIYDGTCSVCEECGTTTGC